MSILSRIMNRWHKTDDADCQVRGPKPTRSKLYDAAMAQYYKSTSDIFDDDEYIPEGNLGCDAPLSPPQPEHIEPIPTTLEERHEADWMVEDDTPKRVTPMPDLSNQHKGLYVGKIIECGDDIWQVLSVGYGEMRIMVLGTGPCKRGLSDPI